MYETNKQVHTDLHGNLLIFFIFNIGVQLLIVSSRGFLGVLPFPSSILQNYRVGLENGVETAKTLSRMMQWAVGQQVLTLWWDYEYKIF